MMNDNYCALRGHLGQNGHKVISVLVSPTPTVYPVCDTFNEFFHILICRFSCQLPVAKYLPAAVNNMTTKVPYLWAIVNTISDPIL